MNTNRIVLEQWSRMARVVDEAAAGLHPQYGKEGIPSDILKRIGGCCLKPKKYFG